MGPGSSLQAHLILLCFTSLCFTDDAFFTNWRFVATLHGASLLVPVFSAFSHSMSLCHILQYFTLFHYYSICYGDLWSTIFDVTIVIVFGVSQNTYNTMNLIDKCVCSDCSLADLSLFLSLCISWNTTILKLGQLTTLQCFLVFKWKEELHITCFKSNL